MEQSFFTGNVCFDVLFFCFLEKGKQRAILALIAYVCNGHGRPSIKSHLFSLLPFFFASFFIVAVPAPTLGPIISRIFPPNTHKQYNFYENGNSISSRFQILWCHLRNQRSPFLLCEQRKRDFCVVGVVVDSISQIVVL